MSSRDAAEPGPAEIAAQYARLQAASAAGKQRASATERVQLPDLLPRLLDVLSGLASHEALRQRIELLRVRSGLLERLMDQASRLPPADACIALREGSLVIGADGSATFGAEERLCIGPGGMGIHGLVGGCTKACLLLNRLASGADDGGSAEQRAVAALVGQLQQSGYADRGTLLAALPGAFCAGLVCEVLERLAPRTAALRDSASAAALARSLDDLLDLSDWIASRNVVEALAMTDDYERQGEWLRAQRLVQDQLSRNTDDAGLLRRYAILSRRLGDSATAEEAFRECLARDPSSGGLRVELAETLLDRLDLDGCEAELAPLPALDAAARRLQARCRSLRDARRQAELPDGLPRLALSDIEMRQGRLEPATHALARELFLRHGVVQLDNVLAATQVAALQDAFEIQHRRHLSGAGNSGALRVGDRRYMLTMALEGALGEASLLCSGLYLPLMRDLLGPECILGAFTAVVSLPGSRDQAPHKDHSALFEERGWGMDLPCFAAQVVIPLRELNATTGSTWVCKGSQRRELDESADTLPWQQPIVPLGSCLLVDYALAHYGGANRSDAPRPILNLVYSRAWFRDFRNYRLQAPVRFGDEFLESAPPDVQSLLNWRRLERQV